MVYDTENIYLEGITLGWLKDKCDAFIFDVICYIKDQS